MVLLLQMISIGKFEVYSGLSPPRIYEATLHRVRAGGRLPGSDRRTGTQRRHGLAQPARRAFGSGGSACGE